MFNCFRAREKEGEKGEERREEGKERERESERRRERPVVKKDFPTIYLHLRAINNSRVRACPRRTLEKKIVSTRRSAYFFAVPSKRTRDGMMRGKWSSFFTSSFLTFPIRRISISSLQHPGIRNCGGRKELS